MGSQEWGGEDGGIGVVADHPSQTWSPEACAGAPVTWYLRPWAGHLPINLQFPPSVKWELQLGEEERAGQGWV